MSLIINGNKVEKEFEIGDYECVILATKSGHRCGYVGLPNNHRCNGMIGSEVEKLGDVDVHGGITYADWGDGHYPTLDSKRYFIGFDCGHSYDGKDLNILNELGDRVDFEHYAEEQRISETHDNIRDKQYVESELIKLVENLRKIDKFRQDIERPQEVQDKIKQKDISGFSYCELTGLYKGNSMVILEDYTTKELLQLLQQIDLNNIR